MPFPIIPARLPQRLGWVVGVLSCLGLLVALNDDGLIELPSGGVLSNLFNLNKENTVPSWFSSSLLLLVAYLARFVSQLDSAHATRFRRLWQLFSALFLLLSLDEAAALHERLQSVMEKHGAGAASSFKFVWVIPALLGCGVLAVAYLRFVIALESSVRWRLIVAGVLYIGGAAGMEVVGGEIFTHFGNGLLYLLSTVLEEMMEMSGAVFCIHTLCRVLHQSAPELFAAPAAARRPAKVRPTPAGSTINPAV